MVGRGKSPGCVASAAARSPARARIRGSAESGLPVPSCRLRWQRPAGARSGTAPLRAWNDRPNRRPVPRDAHRGRGVRAMKRRAAPAGLASPQQEPHSGTARTGIPYPALTACSPRVSSRGLPASQRPATAQRVGSNGDSSRHQDCTRDRRRRRTRNIRNCAYCLTDCSIAATCCNRASESLLSRLCCLRSRSIGRTSMKR